MDNPLPVSAPFGTVSPRGALPQPIAAPTANPLPVAGAGPVGDSPISRKSDTPTLDTMMEKRNPTDGSSAGGGTSSRLPAQPLMPDHSTNPIMQNPLMPPPRIPQPQQVSNPPTLINPAPTSLTPPISPYTVSPGTIPMLNQAGVNNSGAFMPGLQQIQNGQNNPWNVNFESVDHNPFSSGNNYQGLYGSR